MTQTDATILRLSNRIDVLEKEVKELKSITLKSTNNGSNTKVARPKVQSN